MKACPQIDLSPPGVSTSVITRVTEALETLEAALITLFTWALTVIVPTMCILGLCELADRARLGLPPATPLEEFTAIAALAGSSVLGAICVAATSVAFSNRERPFGPAAAIRQRRLPWLLRIVPSAWWLCHFLLGVGAAAVYERSSHPGSIAARFTTGAIAFILTGAANVYLLLAVTALGPFAKAVQVLWRWRLVIDFAVTLLSVIAIR